MPSGNGAPSAGVAGLGNEFRHDDGIGPLVAARVADQARAVLDIGPLAEPLDLLGRWDGADLVVLIDAVRSGAAPGTIGLVDLEAQLRNALDRDGSSTASTHGISLARVFRLALAVGTAPARVVVVGIEGVDFAHGTGLSPAVAGAVPHAVDHVIELFEGLLACV